MLLFNLTGNIAVVKKRTVTELKFALFIVFFGELKVGFV